MTKSGQLWGGRFTEKPNETFAEFNDSFRFDKRLFAADVRASIAHANGIAGAGVLTNEETSAIVGGLDEMLNEAATDPNYLNSSDAEDVHSFIEGKLIANIGDAGRKLHTGRSRNDQVATAFRLWLRDEIDAIDGFIRGVQVSLISAAERHRMAVLPGYASNAAFPGGGAASSGRSRSLRSCATVS